MKRSISPSSPDPQFSGSATYPQGGPALNPPTPVRTSRFHKRRRLNQVLLLNFLLRLPLLTKLWKVRAAR